MPEKECAYVSQKRESKLNKRIYKTLTTTYYCVEEMLIGEKVSDTQLRLHDHLLSFRIINSPED